MAKASNETGPPGNLYSKPVKREVGAAAGEPLELTQTIPPIEPPKDTEYVRHVRMQSKLLSQFWGQPVYVNAAVLVPRDFDESGRHYPVAFYQDHFEGDFRAFSETPPQGNTDKRRTAAYQFYQELDLGVVAPDVAGGDGPCDAFLRRLLRGEYSERGSLWRCLDQGTLPGD